MGIDVHGSLDRAKDVSSSTEALIGRSRPSACAYFATLTTFPSSASRGHLLSSVRTPTWDEPQDDAPDRPRPMFLRQPAKADGT